MRPGTYVLLINSSLSAGLNILFVHTFRMGLLGAPLATDISYWLSFFLLAYIRFVAGGECWGGFDRRCFDHLSTFAHVLPFVALFPIADRLNGSCSDALRGMGRQHAGTAVNDLSHYCGAVSRGISLACHGWAPWRADAVGTA